MGDGKTLTEVVHILNVLPNWKATLGDNLSQELQVQQTHFQIHMCLNSLQYMDGNFPDAIQYI